MPETPLVLPHMGLTQGEARVLEWHRSEGDRVSRGDVVCAVETDKAILDVEANEDGVLRRILVPAGESAAAGDALALIDAEGGAAPRPPAMNGPRTGMAAATEPQAPVPTSRGGERPARAPDPPVPGEAVPMAGTPEGPPARRRATPAARRLAAERGVDLATVNGSGPGGRIQLSDVASAVAAAASPALGPAERARAVIGRRMTESWQTIPQFHVARQVDLTQVEELRRATGPSLERSRGVHLTLTDFLVQAAARALLAHPDLNVGGAVAVHMGLAVVQERSLLVPVLRDAHRLSLVELAAARQALVQRVREGRLPAEALQGATCTLSNLGPFGVDEFAAIINPPERAILAVGRAAERPVVRGGRIEVRPAVTLTVTVDHRAADGVEAARFLADVAAVCESADGWLLF